METRPNFFIIGAPKCGTTSLAHYLGEHPSIFMCDPKEPGYFARELIRPRREPGHAATRWAFELDAYLGLFANADPGCRARGEASTTYLYSRKAATRLRAFDPDAKLIAMLRNPLDLAQSLHAQKLTEGEEDEPEFDAAWRAQAARRAGDRLGHAPRRPELLQYGDVARTGEQMQRVFENFPRSQVLTIFMDRFIESPREVYVEVLNFLGVDDDGRQDFPVHNAGRVIESRWLWRLASAKPAWLLQHYRRWASRYGWRWGGRIRNRLVAASSARKPRQPLSAATVKEMSDFFADDIRLLERLLDVDLDAWRKRFERYGQH